MLKFEMAVALAFLLASPTGWAKPQEANSNSTAIANAPALPAETSGYNRGGLPGRYRDAKGGVKRFALREPAVLYDGGGRPIGQVTKPMMLNIGAMKVMKAEGSSARESFVWAWATEAGSGWVARNALIDPPPVKLDEQRNPKPPREAAESLLIDAASGREKLKGLVHKNSQGELPANGGNRGEHYAGRNPGPKDYVYLLFAVPNVQRGGVARDSLPNGTRFIQGLDEQGRPILEAMTMYRDGDFQKPVRVTFIYGREAGGTLYGWLARANVGDL